MSEQYRLELENFRELTNHRKVIAFTYKNSCCKGFEKKTQVYCGDKQIPGK